MLLHFHTSNYGLSFGKKYKNNVNKKVSNCQKPFKIMIKKSIKLAETFQKSSHFDRFQGNYMSVGVLLHFVVIKHLRKMSKITACFCKPF